MEKRIKDMAVEYFKSVPHKSNGYLASNHENTGQTCFCFIGFVANQYIIEHPESPYKWYDEGSLLSLTDERDDPVNRRVAEIPKEIAEWAKIDLDKNWVSKLGDYGRPAKQKTHESLGLPVRIWAMFDSLELNRFVDFLEENYEQI